MFQFTTQTVYNSIVSDTITAKGQHPNKNANLIISKISNGAGGYVDPYVRIGNTRFSSRQIEKIYMKSATPESLASVTFDMSSIELEDGEKQALARIILYIGLSMNSQDSTYANPYVYKGKPFYVEFKVFTKTGDDGLEVDADKTAKECKRVINKFLLFETDEKLLDVVENQGKVTICGVNGYQQIRKAVLQKFDPDGITIDCCSNQGEFVDIVTGVPVVYTVNPSTGVVTTNNKKLLEDGTQEAIDTDTEVPILPGLEAFGDYNWIIHNLRLPTVENTSYFSSNKAEMPAVGQTYTQFTIVMKDTRDRVAGESVGMRTTSVTTHVLYVATPYAAAVKNALEQNLNVTIDNSADVRLAAPYA